MPKRVNWGALAEEPESLASEHSLARANEREFQVVEAEIDAAAGFRAARDAKRMADSPSSGPRAVVRDETARWSSEVEVVRACVSQGPPRAEGRSIGGSLGRMADRKAEGGGFAATSTRAYEPDLGSDHYRHAWRVWMTLTANERRVLTRMFAELASEGDGGADRIAKTIQGHVRHGSASDAELALPHFAVMLPVEGASAAALVAISLGWAREDATRLERWPDASAVKTEVGAARSKFKAALRRVELDASGESLHGAGGRLPSGTKPLLIPAASMRESDKGATLRSVAACIGLGVVVDGVRGECEVDVVTLRVETAARCPVCNRPRRAQ